MKTPPIPGNIPLFLLVSISSCGVLGSGHVPVKGSKAPSNHGLGIIVGSLHTLQSAGGGFGRPPDLITTSRALFLAHLYGRLDNLHRKSAEDFVKHATGWEESETEETEETESVDSVGNIKDVETLHAAILCYQYLGLPLPKLRRARRFLLEFWHENAGLFAGQKGALPDIRASAHAMAVAEQLGKLHKLHVQTARIRQVLEEFFAPSAAASNSSHANSTQLQQTLFHVPKNLSVGLAPVSANYFAVLVAGLAGFEGINVSAMAECLARLQATDEKATQSFGGIYASSNRTTVTLESTAHAVITLQALTIQAQAEASLSLLLDEAALLSFLSRAPSDLKSAFLAHYALASTPLLTRFFRSSFAYDVQPSSPPASPAAGGEESRNQDKAVTLAAGWDMAMPAPHFEDARQNQVVQGTQLVPLFLVQTFSGLPHSGLVVRLRVCGVGAGCEGRGASGEGGRESRLEWREERKGYQGEKAISTHGVLGELVVEVTAGLLVPGLGEITFDAMDVMRVGYGMKVASAARLGNRSIAVGGEVALGTVFGFQILLFTAAEERVASGAFVVKFHALDSSLLPIDSKVLHGENLSAALAFAYELPAHAALPAGRLHFVFEVAEALGARAHSHTTRWYELPLQMAAFNISIDKPQASLGDSVVVTMTPGVVTHSAFRPYLQRQAHHRLFVMDLVSPIGAVLGSVPGRLAPFNPEEEDDPEAPVSYVFERKVGYNLRSIGPNMLTFRFLPAPSAGPPVPLANMALGPAGEDGAPPRLVQISFFFTVAAKLRVQMVEVPERELAFGSNLTLAFTIRDEVTQTAVDITGEDDAKVYLEVASPGAREVCLAGPLRNTSGQVVGFEVHWPVHANAPSGELNLSLTMQDKEGMANHLLSYATGERWRYTVRVSSQISGTVKSEHTVQEESEAGAGGIGGWPWNHVPGLGEEGDGGGQGEAGGEEGGHGGGGGDGGEGATAVVAVGVASEWESLNLERLVEAQELLAEKAMEVLQLSASVAEEVTQAAWGQTGVAAFVSVFGLVSMERPVVSTLLTARVFFRPRPNPLLALVARLCRTPYSPPPWQPIPELQDLAVPWDAQGRYQVSFTLPLERALSGEYKAELYRPVDLHAWAHQQQLARARKQAREELAETERRRKQLPVIQDDARSSGWRSSPGGSEPPPQPFFQIVVAFQSERMLRDWLGPMQRPLAWASVWALLVLVQVGVYHVVTSDWRGWLAGVWARVQVAGAGGEKGAEGRGRTEKKKRRNRHRRSQEGRLQRGRGEGAGGGGGQGEGPTSPKADETSLSGADHSEVGMSGEDGEYEWDGNLAVWGDMLPWEAAEEEESRMRPALERIDSVDEEEQEGEEQGMTRNTSADEADEEMDGEPEDGGRQLTLEELDSVVGEGVYDYYGSSTE